MMERKGWLFTFIAVVVVGVAVLWMFKYALDQNKEKSFQVEAQAQKAEFLARSFWLRQAQNVAQYKNEVSSLLKTYFQEVSSLNDKYGKSQDLEKKWKDYEQGGANKGTPLAVDLGGSKSKDEKGSFKEAFEYSKQAFDLLQSGRYEPVMTNSKESVRLDFYKLERIGSGDQARVRWSFLLWGPLPEMKYAGMEIKLYDSTGKLVGTMTSASSQPSLRVDEPSVWIAEFPPALTPGYYELPLLPPVTSKFDISFTMGGRSPFGNDVNWVYEFKDITADPSWRMPDGTKWEAQPVEVQEPVAEKKAEEKPKAKKAGKSKKAE
ncbi:MAG: hypothetical protein WC889_18105 [Myxococcota bacterium]|jgi:hypothetical protein